MLAPRIRQPRDRAAASVAREAAGKAVPARRLYAGLGNQATARMLAVRRVVDSPGRPLDAATRADMEARFGHDLSHVRIHDDAPAAASAAAIDAFAFAVGPHLVFGKHRSGSDARRLLAHELAHVVQADRGGSAGVVRRASVTMSSGPGGPDPCADLLEQILHFLNEVAKRINDALDDPHDLYKYFRTTPHPEHGSWEGHRSRFYADRDRLRLKLAEWEADDRCRGYRLSEHQQEELQEANEFKDKEFPEKPARAMREAPETVPAAETGQSSTWITVLKVVMVLGLSVALVGTIVAALADPEPASKLLLAGLTVAEVSALAVALGFKAPSPGGS